MTKYEQEIYTRITHSKEHMTADQIYSALKADYPSVSLATVYNNLNKLCAAKAIRRISTYGSPDRYDRAAKHDHLVCSRCGKLTDICFDDLTASLRQQLQGDFLFYDLKVYGICPQCRNLQESEDASDP